MRSGGGLKILQLTSFALLAALLLATALRFILPAGQVRWFLTPVAFAVLVPALSLAFAATLLRRPSRALVSAALVLLLVAAPPAYALDVAGARLAPLFGMAGSAVVVFACAVVGEHRLRRSSSTRFVVLGALSLCAVLGLSACATVGDLVDQPRIIARAASPNGTWTATGYQTSILPTSDGNTQVFVRRDLGGVIRGELIAYDAEGLEEPQVSWQDSSHLRVGRHVFVLPVP